MGAGCTNASVPVSMPGVLRLECGIPVSAQVLKCGVPIFVLIFREKKYG